MNSINKLRKQRLMPQESLAKKLGMNVEQVTQLYNEENIPSEIQEKLSSIFDVSKETLMKGDKSSSFTRNINIYASVFSLIAIVLSVMDYLFTIMAGTWIPFLILDILLIGGIVALIAIYRNYFIRYFFHVDIACLLISLFFIIMIISQL